MEYVTLNNGVKMPQLGYGVYPVTKMALAAVHTVITLRTRITPLPTLRQGVGRGVMPIQDDSEQITDTFP